MFKIGNEFEIGCGYDNDYKYAAVNEYVDVMTMTGANASTYWEMFPVLEKAVAMTCLVSINNEFVYVIGGFNNWGRFRIESAKCRS